MRLVRQVSLKFQDGTVDDVYEVDLCEAGPGEWVVNYRFGKRLGRLQEGAKTAFPMERLKAEMVFFGMVQDKMREGYEVQDEFGGAEKFAGDARPPERAREDQQVESERKEMEKWRDDLRGKVEEGVKEELVEGAKFSVGSSPEMVAKVEAEAARRKEEAMAAAAAEAEKSDPKTEATLQRIKRGPAADDASDAKDWKWSRAVWRAGFWRLPGMAEALRPWASGLEGMDAYCAAFALGRCGTAEDVLLIEDLLRAWPNDRKLQLMGREALVAILPEEKRGQLLEELKNGPTGEVWSLVEKGESILARDLVVRLLSRKEKGGPLPGAGVPVEEELIDLPGRLYLLSTAEPRLREILFEAVRQVSPKGPGMLLIRQLFKAAEFRLDAEIYGGLVKRIEGSDPSWGGGWDNRLKRWVGPAFSVQTRRYFIRRVRKALEAAGKEGMAEVFITLATGVLMAHDDELDQPRSYQTRDFYWDRESGRYGTRERFHPRRDRFYNFIWLLYGNQEELKETAQKRWYRSVDPEILVTARFEVFPELWNAAPGAVRHLLMHARSAEVQEFATRVWQANPAWVDAVDTTFLAALVTSWFKPTAKLGVELVQQFEERFASETDLILALLNCQVRSGRLLGMEFLKAMEHQLGEKPGFLVQLAFVRKKWSRPRISKVLRRIELSKTQRQEVVPRLIAGLLALEGGEDEAVIAFGVEVLDLLGGRELGKLPEADLAALLAAESEALQLLGAQLLLRRDQLSDLSDAVLEAPLTSSFGAVRFMGVSVFARLSDNELREREAVLSACAVSPFAELRIGVSALVERLVQQDAELAKRWVHRWYLLLLRPEKDEGVHRDVAKLLLGPVNTYLNEIPAEAVPRMLASPSGGAQEVAFYKIKTEIDPDTVEFLTLREWANHPLQELRDWVLTYFDRKIDRLIEHAGDLLPLLESEWEETQDFTMTVCKSRIPEESWTPEALVAVCDSTKGEVQDFGRALITRTFQEENGPLFLECLSEHPATELQVFASNYLQRFASGQPARLEELEPYFLTVLTKIGKGRTAKKRVFELLRQEGLNDKRSAEVALRVLGQVSGTIAVEDKAICLAILYQLGQRWPELASPLKVIEPVVWTPEVV